MEATSFNSCKVYDYINNLLDNIDEKDNLSTVNFSILCERLPIRISKSSFKSRVLYVTISSTNSKNRDMHTSQTKFIKRFNPTTLHDLDLDYIIVSTNLRRKLSDKSLEYYVEGNNIEQEYKENKYYNYSFRSLPNKDKSVLASLRSKFNINEPTIFRGEQQDLVLEDD